MFSTLRTRFGIPGVISVMALVFAMFGGAYAASNSSGGGQATASKAKAKKGPRGPRGATGPAGPQGPTGPQGPAGAKGNDGSNGTSGTDGTDGVDGVSVTSESFSGEEEPTGEPCEENGGSEFESASPEASYACNGSPWTAGGMLPSGKTETGYWALYSEAGGTVTSLSFPVPLKAAPALHFIESAGEDLADCPGATAGPFSTPAAEPGQLCIYQKQGEAGFSIETFTSKTDPSGATLFFAGEGLAFGPWAVTAP